MKIKSAIASARSIDPNLENIINMCGLSSNDSWRNWKDLQNNKLLIKEDNEIKIIKSNQKTQTTNDMFIKANPKNFIKHCYWLCNISLYKQNVIAFLGNDGLLRTSYFKSTKWICNFNPLLLGLENLKYISSVYLNDSYDKQEISNFVPYLNENSKKLESSNISNQLIEKVIIKVCL